MRLELTVSYSHLFRGVRLRGPAAVALPVRASGVDLMFSDGVELEAELVELDNAALALAVPAYETATGHQIKAALWSIVEVIADQDSLTIKLGPRLN